MKKPSLKLSVVLIVFTICVVGILTYVSVLGENHQINRIITTYFDNLKDGMYLEACESFSSNFQEGKLPGDEQRSNFNFLLELSLLKHYNLIDHDDYKVELKRSNFWIPYISDDSVRVSVLLRKKKDKRIVDVLSSDRSKNLVDNLIVVVREKRTWKIRRFALADTSIAGIYNDLRRNVNLNKYVIMTSNGLRFQNAEINFNALTPIDKRLLRFSLYKIQRVLGVSPKKTEGFPMP